MNRPTAAVLTCVVPLWPSWSVMGLPTAEAAFRRGGEIHAGFSVLRAPDSLSFDYSKTSKTSISESEFKSRLDLLTPF
jgi:hypothetical protein